MSRPEITIEGRLVGGGHPPYVVAEMSGNHNGELVQALKLVDVAKRAGADAVKLQTYTADTLTIDCDRADFRITEGLWAGRTLYELYEWAHTPWEWHEALFRRAREVGITIFSSPFDRTAVDFLEELGSPAYKIASFEAVDHELIAHAAGTGKPLIISTGMADRTEMQEAIDVAWAAGCKELAILHCVSGYPAPRQDYNLRTLVDMAETFGLVTGLSDHTLDHVTAGAAVALGAALVEKHFTLDRSGGGPDDSFSVEPPELTALVRHCREVWEAVGEIDYGRKSSEAASVMFRRSLYFVVDLEKGAVVEESDVRSIRPGYGLAPKHKTAIVGRRLPRAVRRGDRVTPDLIGEGDPRASDQPG